MRSSNTRSFKRAQHRRAQRNAQRTLIRARRRSLGGRSPECATHEPLVVICCLLAVLGIAISLFLSQAEGQPGALGLFAASPFAACPRLRRRKRKDDSRRRNIAASYARFSSENHQDAKSIADQQRPCRERAPRDGNQLPSELEFSDEGVSGAKLKREGFDAMLAAAAEGRFGTLYVFDLSRLARESIISATTLRKLVYTYKVRVVSLTEGVDSNNQGWETLATILGLQHEQYLKTLGANVLRGLIGNLLDGLSVGDLAYGYGSVPVRGYEKRRRGRNQRPPKRYVIKEREAKWVRRIFNWFVKERQPIQWIVRELNRVKAPRDKRSRGKKWGRAAVINLLRRTKYIGIWPWGEYRNQRDPETGDIYKEPRDEEEWKDWIRHLPELKIVDEEIFAEAQWLLDENEKKCAEFRGDEGTFTGSAKDQSNPRHLLQRRVRCCECGSYLYVAGARGQYLACPGARDGICKCRTMLPRQLAERLILGEIGRRILDNLAWRKAVHEEAFRAWQTFQCEVPGELEAARDELREVERRISNLVDQIEEGNAPADIRDRLEGRRDERAQLVRRIEQYERQVARRPQVLTTEQIDEALESLHGVLSSGTPAAAIALGNLIGEVVVRPVSRPGRKPPFLRGEFTLRAGNVVDAANGTEQRETATAAAGQSDGETIVIDFVKPDPKYEMSDRAKELFDAGLANWEIAEQLKLRPSRVTLLFNFWHERRGLPVPDRAKRPKRKRRDTPLYKRIADEAKQRWEAGDSESEIGRDFGTTQATVRNAIAWWHSSRNLPVPRFADRRKTQVARAGSMYQAGGTLEKIADVLKVTITTVGKMLDEDFAARSEVRPDGRSRRRRLA
jgi:site-specific DNA recombinase